MSQKSSTFVQQTRERETWLTGALDGEAADPKEREQLLGTAALLRGTVEAIPVPKDAEESSRARALAYMQELREERLVQREARAPWHLRLGHFMRFVFTLGRRR